MKNWKKSLLGLGIVSATLLAACSDDGVESDGAEGGNQEEDITLKIMTWNDNPEGTKKEQEIFDTFTEQYPHITIEQVSATYGEYNERVLTMAAGGNLPDLVWVQPASFGTMVDNEILMDLSENVSEDINVDDYQPGILELGQVDDVQYGMIRDRSTVQIGYNKDLFDEMGVDYPEDDWTMDEFLDISQQLTVEENGRTNQFGIENFYLKELLLSYGTYILDPDSAAVTFDSPEAIEAMKFSQDLINEYNVQPTGAQSEGMSNLFLSGMAAMRMTGPWDWVEYEANADFEFDVVPLPIANDTGTLSPASYLPIGLSADTDYPEEAWDLLKFLTYGEGQDIQAEITGAIPVVERNVDHVYDLAGAPANAESLVNQLQDGSIVLNVPYHPDFPEIENRLTSVVETLNLNNSPVEEAINKLADEIRNDFNLE